MTALQDIRTAVSDVRAVVPGLRDVVPDLRDAVPDLSVVVPGVRAGISDLSYPWRRQRPSLGQSVAAIVIGGLALVALASLIVALYERRRLAARRRADGARRADEAERADDVAEARAESEGMATAIGSPAEGMVDLVPPPPAMRVPAIHGPIVGTASRPRTPELIAGGSSDGR